MDFEVRHVSGIENCFLSLPLPLIQTLESTRPGLFSQVLTLELRCLSTDRHWTAAWSGASSSSSSIEIARQFAECISLPDNTTVQVRVVSSVASATLVTIEPDTEDDWEVLELNAEQAEAAILKQVRIVHEGMRFPLWLHGRTIITFVVVSTSPKKSVAEVAVAPKRRKKDVKKEGSGGAKEYNMPKALLRLQDSDERLFHTCDVEGLEVSVALTSVGYVHPETAKRFSLDALQLVVVLPRLSLKQSMNAPDGDVSRMKNASVLKEEKNEARQAVVRILFSDSMAKGHLMIAPSLRSYLRAGSEVMSLSLSPCHFKMIVQEKNIEKNGLQVLDSQKIQKPINVPSKTGPMSSVDSVDLSIHDEVVSALSHDFTSEGDGETTHESDNRKGLRKLLQAWFLAQLNAISSIAGAKVDSLLLGKETLLQFEVKGYDFRTNRKVKVSSNSRTSLENRNNTGRAPVGFLYVLTVSEESLPSTKSNVYKLALDKDKNDHLQLTELFGKLLLGDPVSFYSVKEKTSMKNFGSDVSSLSWMGTSASDVINRMTVLLSPVYGSWFSSHDIPLPGHVLIFGPH
ncbi:hypothetical protein Tsubulata_041120, partial [Turnera subulata]